MQLRFQTALALALGACAGSGAPLVAEPIPDPAPQTAPKEQVDQSAAPTPSHVYLSTAPRRMAPNGKGQVALLAEGNQAFVGELRLDALAEIPPHRDPTEEYIVVLEGGGTLLMDGKGYQLKAGSTVFMPANAEVSFANGPSPLVALQVFAGPDSARKYDSWKPADARPDELGD